MGVFKRVFRSIMRSLMDPNKIKLECPNCTSKLRFTQINDLPVYLCDNCGHFVMDIKHFKNIVGEDPRTEVRKRKQKEEMVHCPACGDEMPLSKVHDHEVDICRDCGVVHSGRSQMKDMAGVIKGVKQMAREEKKGKAYQKDGDTTMLGFVLKMDEDRNTKIALESEHIDNLTVDSAFVLYKDGLLIHSWTKSLKEDMDEDIVGSMISAISNFVQTSFKGYSEKDTPLESIRFRKKEIAFERGKYILIALELPGKLDRKNREKLSKGLSKIEKEHKGLLKDWGGELDDIDDVVHSFKELLVPLMVQEG